MTCTAVIRVKKRRERHKLYTNSCPRNCNVKYLWSHPVWTALQRKIIRLSCKLNTDKRSSIEQKKKKKKTLQGPSKN
jgi:hypothetical protein